MLNSGSNLVLWWRSSRCIQGVYRIEENLCRSKKWAWILLGISQPFRNGPALCSAPTSLFAEPSFLACLTDQDGSVSNKPECMSIDGTLTKNQTSSQPTTFQNWTCFSTSISLDRILSLLCKRMPLSTGGSLIQACSFLLSLSICFSVAQSVNEVWKELNLPSSNEMLEMMTMYHLYLLHAYGCRNLVNGSFQ